MKKEAGKAVRMLLPLLCFAGGFTVARMMDVTEERQEKSSSKKGI